MLATSQACAHGNQRDKHSTSRKPWGPTMLFSANRSSRGSKLLGPVQQQGAKRMQYATDDR